MSKLTEIEWASLYGLLREAIDKMLEQRHALALKLTNAEFDAGHLLARVTPEVVRALVAQRVQNQFAPNYCIVSARPENEETTWFVKLARGNVPSTSPSGGEVPADAGPKKLHREAKRARRQAAIEALRKAAAQCGLPACDAWEALALWLEGLDDE